MQRFEDLGLETAITELDVRFTLPESGVPTAEQLAEQADGRLPPGEAAARSSAGPHGRGRCDHLRRPG